MIILQLLSIPLCGFLDRMRGSPSHILGKRIFDKIAYGVALGVAAGYMFDPIALFLITVAMVVGMSPGWGEPFAAVLLDKPMDPARLEWWQVGKLAKNANLALVARGVMWGAPMLLTIPVLGWQTPLVFVISFALAMWVSMYCKVITLFTDDIWARVEIWRGAIAASLIVIGTSL